MGPVTYPHQMRGALLMREWHSRYAWMDYGLEIVGPFFVACLILFILVMLATSALPAEQAHAEELFPVAQVQQVEHIWHHVRRHRIAYRRHVTRFPDLVEQSWRAGSNVLATASRFIGGGNPTGFRGPWCMAFVEMVLRKTGHYAMRSLRAIDALRLGPHVQDPRPGDIAVMRHHVTFVAKVGRVSIIGLGGNQSHRVRYSKYPRGRIIAFVRPQEE